MKATLRFSLLAVVLSVVTGLSATGAIAQNPCEDADGIAVLDGKIRTNFEKVETLEIAIEAAKEYLGRYGECEPTKDFAEWIKARMPAWEKTNAIYKEYVWRKARIEKFDKGIEIKKFDDVYAAGGELVQRYPDNVNYLLPLALIGLYESYRNNYKYNDDSIRYAKAALAKLKSGTAEPKKGRDGKPKLDPSGKEVFGVYQFERNAEQAISELTYTLGYILYHAKKDRRAGLLYYYEVSQTPGPYKTEPRLYATIGQYYRDESAPMANEIVDLIKKQAEAKTDEEKQNINTVLEPKIALYNGYLERALDAFSRAYKFADGNDAAEKALKDQVYKLLQDTYGRREPPVPIDSWIAGATSTPLPNPTSDVAPVYDPDPVESTPEKPVVKQPAGVAKPVSTKPATDKEKPAPTTKPRR